MSTSLATNINQIGNSIVYYNNIVFLVVGVPFNLVNILMFTRLILNKKNKTNMGFLGLCQSIVDITMLVYFSLVLRSTIFFGMSFTNTIDSLCKFIFYFRRMVVCSSSWMQVFTTFDRFIFVIFGHAGRFKFMKQKRHLAIIIFGILILLALANITNLFYYISKGICTADSSILVASDMILIITRLYIPIFLMIFFNLFMIRTVFKKRNTALRQTSNAKKEYLFTISVIANDAFYLLFHLPGSIYYILYDINLYSGAINGDPLFAANYMFYGNIVQDFSLYMQTFSFFVYFAFNKIYRKEFLDIIGKVIPIKRNSSVLPSNVVQT